MNTTKDNEEKRGGRLEFTLFISCVVIVGTLVLGLTFHVLYTMYRGSLIHALNLATGLVTFFANAAVLFYAFPAFTRTKDRSLLIIALAALVFAYGALWGLLFSVKPLTTATQIGRMQMTWLFATRYCTTIIGLILYAYGVIKLVRRVGPPDDLTKR